MLLNVTLPLGFGVVCPVSAPSTKMLAPPGFDETAMLPVALLDAHDAGVTGFPPPPVLDDVVDVAAVVVSAAPPPPPQPEKIRQ